MMGLRVRLTVESRHVVFDVNDIISLKKVLLYFSKVVTDVSKVPSDFHDW